jgi:hypothetical protein
VRSTEPVRYPIEPLSSEEDLSDNTSKTPSNDVDAGAPEETSATPAQRDEMSGPSIDKIVDSEDDAMILPECKIAGCFRDDSFLEKGTLGLEQLFAMTQHKLEEIQDMLMLEKDGDTTSPGPAEVEAEGDSNTETEPLSVFLNGNWNQTNNRQHGYPK